MRGTITSFALLLVSAALAAQQPSQPQQSTGNQATQQPATAPSTPPKPVISTTARLQAAKTVFVKNAGGSDVPFNVISQNFDGWARFIPVYSEDKADLVVEVLSPEEPDDTVHLDTGGEKKNHVSVGGQEQQEQTVKATKTFTVSNIRMTVIEAKTKIRLWTASDNPKTAMRKNARQDKMVESAQKLFKQFHDRVEPE